MVLVFVFGLVVVSFFKYVRRSDLENNTQKTASTTMPVFACPVCLLCPISSCPVSCVGVNCGHVNFCHGLFFVLFVLFYPFPRVRVRVKVRVRLCARIDYVHSAFTHPTTTRFPFLMSCFDPLPTLPKSNSLSSQLQLEMRRWKKTDCGTIVWFDIYIIEKHWLRYAGLAQSVERQALNLVVVGSSPTAGDYNFTKCGIWPVCPEIFIRPDNCRLYLIKWP